MAFGARPHLLPLRLPHASKLSTKDRDRQGIDGLVARDGEAMQGAC